MVKNDFDIDVKVKCLEERITQAQLAEMVGTSASYISRLINKKNSIVKKLEIHYTPKHGSWLDIAEIELNVMTRQCLSRRIESIDILRSELAAWEQERNSNQATVNWQFRTKDARIIMVLRIRTTSSKNIVNVV